MVTPVFPQQRASALAGELPAPVRVFPREENQPGTELWVIPFSMPGRGELSFSYCTVYFGPDSVTVVDPGWPTRTDVHGSIVQPLRELLERRGRRLDDIAHVISTHAHPDHLGSAEAVARAAGAKLVVGAREWECIEAVRAGTGGDAYGVTPESVGAPRSALGAFAEESSHVRDHWYFPASRPEILLEPGDDVPGFPFRVLLTPGHTDGHLCFVSDSLGIVLAADMVLPRIYPGIGLSVASLGGNPVAEYLGSLSALAQCDDFVVVPGHGFVFTDFRSRRLDTAAHVLRRAQEVREALRRHPGASAWEVASDITWSLGWEGMQASRRLISGLRQTLMYRDLVSSGELERWEAEFSG